MTARTAIFAGTIVALSLTGCGTVSAIRHRGPVDIYGGIKFDLWVISELGYEGPASTFAYGLLFSPDLVLSFVADSIVLPVTIPMSARESEPSNEGEA